MGAAECPLWVWPWRGLMSGSAVSGRGPREVQGHRFLDKTHLIPRLPRAGLSANLSASGREPGYLARGILTLVPEPKLGSCPRAGAGWTD